MIGPRAVDWKWPAPPAAVSPRGKNRAGGPVLSRSAFDEARAALAGGAWGIVLVAAIVEAVLLFRLWAQVTAREFSSGLFGLIYSLSDALVEPFQSLNEAEPIRQTGILDIAVLVAIQTYLALAIMTVVAFWASRFLVLYLEERQVRQVRAKRSQQRRRRAPVA